jgi:hypothetical protein
MDKPNYAPMLDGFKSLAITDSNLTIELRFKWLMCWHAQNQPCWIQVLWSALLHGA